MFDKKCFVNFRKWFTFFKSENHFPKDAIRIRPLLNNTIDIHVKAVDHHRNIADTKIWQPQVNVAGIRSAQIPATKLIVFRPPGRNLARTARFRPAARIWPEYPSQNGRPAGSGQKIPASMPESDRSGPDSDSFGRNPANSDSDETIRILAFI
jgi:hypothetical protein